MQNFGFKKIQLLTNYFSYIYMYIRYQKYVYTWLFIMDNNKENNLFEQRLNAIANHLIKCSLHFYLPSSVTPGIWVQTTFSSSFPNVLLQTVPQALLIHSSTLPSKLGFAKLKFPPPASLNSPEVQSSLGVLGAIKN